MKMTKIDKGYKVESLSTKGKTYSVDPKKPWCDCPAYHFRAMKKGGVCKHIQAVRDILESGPEAKKKAAAREELLAYLDVKGRADSIELIEKYGEDLVDSYFWVHNPQLAAFPNPKIRPTYPIACYGVVDSLIQSGDVVEKKGVISLMG